AYAAEDPTGPRSVYGQTKLDGELAVAAANARHLIVRTAWVYSPFGRNFARTMVCLGRERESIAVVSDQWGNPTSALDIADGILHVAARLHSDRHFQDFGIYHLAGTGSTNWSGFAREIFAQWQRVDGTLVRVEDIGTPDYPTKAERPLNARLNTDKLFRVFGWRAPDWRRSTAGVVERILCEPNLS
ncbi:MAG: SDR family oxidoreductase, partial [Alphaproteobacteria bacterium]